MTTTKYIQEVGAAHTGANDPLVSTNINKIKKQKEHDTTSAWKLNTIIDGI